MMSDDRKWVEGHAVQSWELAQRQSLPLSAKIRMSEIRIREWYDHWQGQVYVAFSGGKDSTVLLHLVRSIYPEVTAVFSDTGLEYPEIREFIKTNENVIWVKPKMSFAKVIEVYGYPVVSKMTARGISDLQRGGIKNPNVYNLRLTGINSKGLSCKSFKLPQKWRYLETAPFKVSEKCCDIIKKSPLHLYNKKTQTYPFIGNLAGESHHRNFIYRKYGCNALLCNHPYSAPLSVWTEQNILHYLQNNSIPFSTVYGNIQKKNNILFLTGEQRTGCMFCMFGVHLEGEPNRFQRMRISHPQQYRFCMDKLGIGTVLDYMGIAH